jgi:molecular chaperone IbpA
MRTVDFSPFYRSSIGFDRLFNLLEDASHYEQENWPPYDIVKGGPDDYAIVMAVPGFAQNEIEVTNERNLLLVSGSKDEGEEAEYLHHGIGARTFTRKFELAVFMEVKGAHLENGMLTIELRRELPEAMKPRRIEIGAPSASLDPKQIEGNKNAA